MKISNIRTWWRGSTAARESVQLLIRIISLAAIFWFFFSYVFLLTRMEGNGMFPSLKDGDLLFAFRLQREYRSDDIIVYEVNGKESVGRIAAKEKDIVLLDEQGTLRINGTVQAEEILYPTYAKENTTYPYEVPQGQLFVLGDYRTQTEDSRDFGAISMDQVKGKVITLLRRRGV